MSASLKQAQHVTYQQEGQHDTCEEEEGNEDGAAKEPAKAAKPATTSPQVALVFVPPPLHRPP